MLKRRRGGNSIGKGWKGRACWAKTRVARREGGRGEARRVVRRKAVRLCVRMDDWGGGVEELGVRVVRREGLDVLPHFLAVRTKESLSGFWGEAGSDMEAATMW